MLTHYCIEIGVTMNYHLNKPSERYNQTVLLNKAKTLAPAP